MLLEQMDKAALLGTVVEHLKQLKRTTLEVSKLITITIPNDIDGVTFIDQEASSTRSTTGTMFIRASVCCNDRAEHSEKTAKYSIFKCSTHSSFGGQKIWRES